MQEIETFYKSSQADKHFSRGEKVLGQFFTPKEVVNFILDFVLLNQNKKNRAIDPACGDGIFLRGLIERGFKEIIGLDVDKGVLNSVPEDIKSRTIILNKNGLLTDVGKNFDVVVGNPPFSAKYGRVKDKSILEIYEMGQGRKTQSVEILFLERFIQLASPGGTIGIILPSGIFSNLPLRYVRQFIVNNVSILGVISLPRHIFNSSKKTSSKTCILFAQKKSSQERKVFMGIADKLDDLPLLLSAYRNGKNSVTPRALWVNAISEALYPEFYTPLSIINLNKIPWPILKFKEIIYEMFCGKTEYGENRSFVQTGIRFISAKTVTRLGIDFSRDGKYIGPGSSMDKCKARVKVGDLLFVRVGVGCIGRSSVITDHLDTGVADDWIYIIRPKKCVLPTYLAFYLQSKYGSAQIERLKHGVGTVTIPQSALKEILVPVLPLEIQEEFNQIYLRMIKHRRENRYDKAQADFDVAIKRLENFLEQSREG
jgi:type I restriction enzyme M protein